VNTLFFDPADVLFFRDGRPMSGSLAGHGDSWPLPSAMNAALHAALHRDYHGEVHTHRSARNGKILNNDREWKFGSLVTVGPFPVCTNGSAPTWFFPRPLDAINEVEKKNSEEPKVTFLPLDNHQGGSSLPKLLRYPVANLEAASKDTPKNWWSTGSWSAYLGVESPGSNAVHFKNNGELYNSEHSYGIGIDPESGTAEEGMFYSAHSLRLGPGIVLGLLAKSRDKGLNGGDLLQTVFDPTSSDSNKIIVGGQQRMCTVSLTKTAATLPLPLPVGMISGFEKPDGKYLVKWVLLTHSIWPVVGEHAGGWMPNWVDNDSGDVKLLDGPGKNFAVRHKVDQGKEIKAKLVAAIVGKPVVVAGYAEHNDAAPERVGNKSTHLAVPAGSVYYFKAETKGDAEALAAALNWHGSDTTGTTIKNRRSTIMGEKGFGLGVCSTWDFHKGNIPGHPNT